VVRQAFEQLKQQLLTTVSLAFSRYRSPWACRRVSNSWFDRHPSIQSLPKGTSGDIVP